MLPLYEAGNPGQQMDHRSVDYRGALHGVVSAPPEASKEGRYIQNRVLNVLGSVSPCPSARPQVKRAVMHT